MATKKMWFVQWLRPDGWWSIANEHGPVACPNRKLAKVQLKAQQKNAPLSKWRISRKPGFWEMHEPYDRIKNHFDELSFFLSCEPFTDADCRNATQHAQLLRDEALHLQTVLRDTLHELQEDNDDAAFRIVHRAVRDGSRRFSDDRLGF